MVKISNGVNTFQVTRGAYESVYVHQGYKLVAEERCEGATSVEPTPVDTDEAFVEALLEKPVSQWSKGEVKRYANVVGLDITGTKNVNAAKELVKAYLETPLTSVD